MGVSTERWPSPGPWEASSGQGTCGQGGRHPSPKGTEGPGCRGPASWFPAAAEKRTGEEASPGRRQERRLFGVKVPRPWDRVSFRQTGGSVTDRHYCLGPTWNGTVLAASAQSKSGGSRGHLPPLLEPRRRGRAWRPSSRTWMSRPLLPGGLPDTRRSEWEKLPLRQTSGYDSLHHHATPSPQVPEPGRRQVKSRGRD